MRAISTAEAALAARPRAYARSTDTRHRLVESAIETFAELGYEGATTRLLAERAGVNLPAIQYHFGGKEGLYRAAIEHIAAYVETCMAPAADRVRAALKRGKPPRAALLSLLTTLLDAFVALVIGDAKGESRKRLISRAEIDNFAALASLHESMMRQAIGPCAALVGRLIGKPAEDRKTVIRALAILGQASIFCHQGARRALDWQDFSDTRVREVQAAVRGQTRAVFRAGAGR